MRRAAVVISALLLVAGSAPSGRTQTGGGRPVIFVHGMGSSAAEVGTNQFADLLSAIAGSHPASDGCQQDAQPDRRWNGSPCVFRYVDDAAGPLDGQDWDGPADSQSAVQPNAEKLAGEVEEVALATGRRVVLIGYSMGGAIIRTYLALHHEEAERDIEAVILIDAVASGSWGYAFAGALPRRLGPTLGAHMAELLRSAAAAASDVDFSRPATRDLSPRSRLFRTIAPVPVPANISYYTFWGDIQIVAERQLLTYTLPSFVMPSLGDLGLLPGDPDPTALPELGGQRFSPPVASGQMALDVPHRARIEVDGTVIRDLLNACGHRPPPGEPPCSEILALHFEIPNSHTAIPTTLGQVMVDEPVLGGNISLLEAVLRAVGRHR